MSREPSENAQDVESLHAAAGNVSISAWEQQSKAESQEESFQKGDDQKERDSPKIREDLDNGQLFELRQKHLQGKQPRRAVSQRPASRSVSYVNCNTETPPRSSVCGVDIALSLRFRSIIRNARRSASCRSLPQGSCGASSMALTEGEKFALERMIDREERRLNALHRVNDDDRRRDRMLLAQEIARESASLDRIWRIEQQKMETLRQRQERRETRMEEARKRRDLMESVRVERLESIQQQREDRISRRNPFGALGARMKYMSRSSCVDV